MSLKALRKQATTPKKNDVVCPACGQTVAFSKISEHHRVCKAWEVAVDDSNKAPPGSIQVEKVRQHLTFSARTFPLIVASKIVQNHWLFMITSLCALSFLVGYEFPLWWPLFIVLPFFCAYFVTITILEIKKVNLPRFFRRKQT